MERFTPDENRLKSVEENYKRVLENVKESAVKAGRSESDVRLMCVTKTVEPVYINRARCRFNRRKQSSGISRKKRRA